jgi:hypothetical protein
MSNLSMQNKSLSEQEEESYLLYDFVRLNPYQTDYDKMSAILPMQLDAEYGLSNHEWCKNIYENMDDSKLILYIISNIKRCGGQQALNANLMTLLDYSPIETSNNMFVQNYFKKFIFDIYYKD